MDLEEIGAKPLARETRDHSDQVPGHRDPDLPGEEGTIIQEPPKMPRLLMEDGRDSEEALQAAHGFDPR
jgi:hypothetical protein